MNSLNFPDTNVWLALVWGRHSHADLSRRWFERASHGRLFFCRFTQLALLRLLTTEAVMGRDVLTMASTWDIYDQCSADERIAFLAEPEGLDPGLRSFTSGRRASPKLWADAYLAAFANAAGLRLVTFDRAFRSKPVNCEVLD
ncbi:MAG: PIN domain-containing protein [Acidobacteriota bacterium]|nr:PIN domain-containing protein [Acidobacteriota bacterium]